MSDASRAAPDAADSGPTGAAAPMPQPLAGITVVDLSHIYNGPYATFLMAMAGANVVKVEPPDGEHLRLRANLGGASAPFASLNSNKRTVTLNLKSARGREILHEMVRRADVLVENFAPGVTERLGLGAQALQSINPRLIYASSTGFGQTGPYRDYPAMDLTIQAMSGVMSVTGFPDRPPVKAGPAVADFFGGTHLFGGIMMALYERERTGVGRVVEVSMQEAVYASLNSSLGMYFGKGRRNPVRTGNRHAGLAEAPYNVYPARDGYIAIICNNNRHFHALLAAMGREDLKADPRFADLKARIAHIDEIDALVGAWTRDFDRAKLVERFLAHRVPHAPVREISEVVEDPNMHARGTLQWIDHPEFGRLVVQHSPIRLQGTPLEPIVPSRRLGADNTSVYVDWLGLDPAELERLAEQQVV